MNADARTAEIATALAQVRPRIAAAAALSGREVDDITLIAVTKTYPADDVARLMNLGVCDVGENRDQEAAPKSERVAVLLEHRPRDQGQVPVPRLHAPTWPALRWHFVGQLQTNKAKSVVRYAAAVHSVDRIELVAALSRAASAAHATMQCFVQVSLDADRGRGGAIGAEVLAVADAVALAGGLDLAGVMTVAPMKWEPARAFDEVRRISERLQEGHPTATAISAGMSEDYEAAITAGATHVRLGSAILGRRPALG
jgi:PLP dependent protein